MNGWTLERRGKQEGMIRQWRLWQQSTGLQTDAGKQRSSQNVYKHGGRNAEMQQLHRLMAHYNKNENM